MPCDNRIQSLRFKAYLFPSGEWYRVVHHDDPVPHLPTPLMGGIGRGQYEVCDGSGEDQQCSSGTMLSAEITDHLTHLRDLTHPIHDCVNPYFPHSSVIEISTSHAISLCVKREDGGTKVIKKK